jgi:hypothetical protein
VKQWFYRVPFAILGLGLGLGLGLVACGSDNDDTGRDPAECDKIADQIRIVAERDPDLENYDGFDRRANPCADPIPVTSRTDYKTPCEALQKCLDEVK